MRYLVIIFLCVCIAFSCVKPKTKDPVPVIEFKRVESMVRLPATASLPERDTASLVIGYADGDGDLFRNVSTDGPNFIWATYYFNSDLNKFVKDAADTTISNADVILQPADGYYKGKSIEGDIYRPLKEFRSTSNHKILKFVVFMTDMKNHKSNVVSSPVYTLTF